MEWLSAVYGKKAKLKFARPPGFHGHGGTLQLHPDHRTLEHSDCAFMITKVNIMSAQPGYWTAPIHQCQSSDWTDYVHHHHLPEIQWGLEHGLDGILDQSNPKLRHPLPPWPLHPAHHSGEGLPWAATHGLDFNQPTRWSGLTLTMGSTQPAACWTGENVVPKDINTAITTKHIIYHPVCTLVPIWI